MISAHGAITIKRTAQDANFADPPQLKNERRATSTEQPTKPGTRQRQVVVHKLTMGPSALENSRQIVVRTSGGAETHIAALSPKGADDLLDNYNANSKENSVTEQTSSHYQTYLGRR